MYYVTMQITFLTRKFRNVERNLHYDVVRITTVWVSSLTLDCNGVFAIKAGVGTTARPAASRMAELVTMAVCAVAKFMRACSTCALFGGFIV